MLRNGAVHLAGAENAGNKGGVERVGRGGGIGVGRQEGVGGEKIEAGRGQTQRAL